MAHARDKAFLGHFFEDFRLGQSFLHATPRTISSGDVALYLGLTGSRHVLHCAEPVAKRLGFREAPIDNLLAFHIAFGKTVPDVSLNAVANLGYADLRFLRPVYVGDTLFVESDVIGLKENSSGKSGIVYVHSRAYNQDDHEVLCWKRWVMVHKRDSERPAVAESVPELPEVVELGHLPLPDGLRFAEFDRRWTGSAAVWDDYRIGERIDHPDGLTVDDSDHTLATKLYQNNAKVHFDQHLMAQSTHGRRLMYGGHVISVCRALSYCGLENALWLAAINSGTHANPSYGGDTFFAWSEVLDKAELPGRKDVGALRLRLVGLKNCRPEDLQGSHLLDEGRRRYRSQVVLDLDYWALMPR
ncbi:MAG: MaoC family dehydratase [Gammaproteobacteria bacterium]|nr:MaoC family dehydratase [Gammaproteobacteria bacterium]